jgi:flavin reductase (DIM6/NTAB) family NADH-FMN oxidoreductase RutF
VNILSDDQEHLSTLFSAGVDHDERFLQVETEEFGGAPMIRGCLANALCEVHTEFSVGDRALVVGRPLAHRINAHHNPMVLFRRSSLSYPHPGATLGSTRAKP